MRLKLTGAERWNTLSSCPRGARRPPAGTPEPRPPTPRALQGPSSPDNIHNKPARPPSSRSSLVRERGKQRKGSIGLSSNNLWVNRSVVLSIKCPERCRPMLHRSQDKPKFVLDFAQKPFPISHFIIINWLSYCCDNTKVIKTKRNQGHVNAKYRMMRWTYEWIHKQNITWRINLRTLRDLQWLF